MKTTEEGALPATSPLTTTTQTRVPRPAERRTARIPSLDGFRALSIVMVMLAHGTHTAFFPPQATHVLRYVSNGNLGVRFFFVISGFLITTLLLQEEERHGKVSLRLFYERRAVRILPVYWTYISVVAILALFGHLVVAPRAFAESLTFTTSWFHTHQWVFEHTWSLSVEEAFYLLWPLLFALLSFRKRVILALGVILAGPLLRGWLYHLHGEDYFAYYSLGVQGNIDPIMWGCLLALLHQAMPEDLHRICKKFPLLGHGLFMLAMLALIKMNDHLEYHPLVSVPFTVTISCVGVCYLVYFHSFVSKGIGFKILNHPWIVKIGVLSYSLYLWQQVFLFPAEQHQYWWQQFPWNFGFAILVATSSYYLLESPFLRLRQRLRNRSNG